MQHRKYTPPPHTHTKYQTHYVMHTYYALRTLLRAYRLLKEKIEGRHVSRHLAAKFICKLKIVEILNMHSEVQTAAVTIISYKPLSDLNFTKLVHRIVRQLHALSLPFGILDDTQYHYTYQQLASSHTELL